MLGYLSHKPDRVLLRFIKPVFCYIRQPQRPWQCTLGNLGRPGRHKVETIFGLSLLPGGPREEAENDHLVFLSAVSFSVKYILNNLACGVAKLIFMISPLDLWFKLIFFQIHLHPLTTEAISNRTHHCIEIHSSI